MLYQLVHIAQILCSADEASGGAISSSRCHLPSWCSALHPRQCVVSPDLLVTLLVPAQRILTAIVTAWSRGHTMDTSAGKHAVHAPAVDGVVVTPAIEPTARVTLLRRPVGVAGAATAESNQSPHFSRGADWYGDEVVSSAFTQLVQGWVEGRVSNLDYLLQINYLAGRYCARNSVLASSSSSITSSASSSTAVCDDQCNQQLDGLDMEVPGACNPSYHPYLPWVVDFQSEVSMLD